MFSPTDQLALEPRNFAAVVTGMCEFTNTHDWCSQTEMDTFPSRNFQQLGLYLLLYSPNVYSIVCILCCCECSSVSVCNFCVA